ncbi:MAG: AAA family ATPase [Candidatus Micrarchaeia archaeon]
MAKFVIIMGSPGAGKSTLIDNLNDKYKVVNVGSLMLKHALALHYVTDRDEIRYLDKTRMDKLRFMAFDDIKKMEGKILIDTHASVEQNGRFAPGTPKEALKRIGLTRIKALIYIDASTKDIILRRKSDKSRRREMEPEILIDTQRMINIALLSAYSSDLNIPLYIIFNKQGKIKESASELAKHILDAFS